MPLPLGTAILISTVSVSKLKPPMLLEVDDEQRYVDWCTQEQIICEKVKFVTAGYPDRLSMLPTGLHVWIEFKRRGKKPEKNQLYRIAKLRFSGALAGWTDDSRIAIDAVSSILAATRLPETWNQIATLAIRWGFVFGPRFRKDEYLFGSSKDIEGQRVCLQMFDRSAAAPDVQGMA
jgi:hypothetical protein